MFPKIEAISLISLIIIFILSMAFPTSSAIKRWGKIGSILLLAAVIQLGILSVMYFTGSEIEGGMWLNTFFLGVEGLLFKAVAFTWAAKS